MNVEYSNFVRLVIGETSSHAQKMGFTMQVDQKVIVDSHFSLLKFVLAFLHVSESKVLHPLYVQQIR